MKIYCNTTRFALFIFLLFFIVSTLTCLSAEEISDTESDMSETDGGIVGNITDNAMDSQLQSHEVDVLEDSAEPADTSISASDVNMKYRDGSKLVVKVESTGNVEGKYVGIQIANESYWRPIQNGQAELTIYLKEGTYTAKCFFNYSGFRPASCTAKITVTTNKTDTVLTAEDVFMEYNDGTSYIVQLTDINGEPIPNAFLNISINGKSYYKTTDEMGMAMLTLSYGAGTYTVTTKYNGDYYNYKPSNTTSTVQITKVKTVLTVENFTGLYDNKTRIIIFLRNIDERGLNNSYIITRIGNRTYYGKTDEEGRLVLEVNLKPGTYSVVSEFNGTKGYEKAKGEGVIVILPIETVIDVEGFTKYYRNGTNLEGTLYYIDPLTNGTVFMNNTYISIIIGENTYYRVTDSQGKFSLAVNLRPGNYTFTVLYRGYGRYSRFSKDINVSVINHKVTMEIADLVKYYRNDSNLRGRLLLSDDGEMPFRDAYVKISFKNMTYNVKTDEEGYFSLNVNLLPGEYPFKIAYSNRTGYTDIVRNINVTVLKYDTRLVVDSFTKLYRNGTNLQGKLYLVKGNETVPYQNAYVNITFKNVSYNVRTDENGSFMLNINLAQGKYPVDITYKGRAGYSSAGKTISITVLPYQTSIDADNFVKYYRNDTNLQGILYIINPVTKTRTPYHEAYVQVLIGKNTYNLKTDENGQFRLTINLSPGEYNLPVTFKARSGYAAFTRNVNIKVVKIPTRIIADNLTKYYHDGNNLFIKLVNRDGKPLANSYINFTISSVSYSRKTNSEGIANLTVNLYPGKYNVTVYYRGSTGISSSKAVSEVTINKMPISIQSLGADIPVNGSYRVQVKDVNGKTAANVAVTFQIGTRKYYKYTDSNGIAALPMNRKKGNYNVEVLPGTGYTSSRFIETVAVI